MTTLLSLEEGLTEETLRVGVDRLAERDPGFRRIVAHLGPPPLWAREPGFETLLQIILEQQVSLASARATLDRLRAAADPLTPATLLALDDLQLRGIGFSRQKVRYARSLSICLVQGELDLDALAGVDDTAVRTALLRVQGIGPWTADIYLLMALRRPDAWPAGDLALVKAVQSLRGLAATPGAQEMALMAEEWRPWRAVAARLLWHFYLSGGAAAAQQWTD